MVYFDPSTLALQTGWVATENGYLYFDTANWNWAYGWKQVDGQWYYFNPIAEQLEVKYILNTNSLKFHYPYCDSVSKMKEQNKAEFYGTRDEAIALGYDPCKRCNP